jgi:hypothetical protein
MSDRVQDESETTKAEDSILFYVLLSFFGVWMRDASKLKFGLKSHKNRGVG